MTSSFPPHSLPFPGTVTSSFASTSRAADDFKITSLHWFGLDLDHTLVRYHLKPFFEMVYKCFLNYMLQIKGDTYGRYREFLDQPFDHDFISKGLAFEFSTGNLLRLDCEGAIIRASHGTRQLSTEEIVAAYGPSRKFPYFADVSVGTRNPNCEYFTTYFDMPAALMVARLVDAMDALDPPSEQKAEGEAAKYHFRSLLQGALAHNFEFTAFSEDRGWYFPEMKQRTSLYVYKRTKVRQWLQHLRNECKVRIFLLTNSHADYSECLLDYAFGPDWREVFDLIICRGQKPGFFCATNPFFYLDWSTKREGTLLENAAEKLQRGDNLVQGNAKDLIAFFERNKFSDPLYEGTPKPTARLQVAYSGDHIHGDVVAVNQHTDWWTVAVLEEMWDDYHHDFTGSIPDHCDHHHLKHAYHMLGSATCDTPCTTDTPCATSAATATETATQAAMEAAGAAAATETTQIAVSTRTINVEGAKPEGFSGQPQGEGNEAEESNEFHMPTFNVLASKRWGSFFVHSHEHEHLGEERPAKRPRSGPVQGPVLTHLAHLIISHSTIVVPCLSALANFDEEKHEPVGGMGAFAKPALPPSLAHLNEQHGFHPYLPPVFHGITYKSPEETN